jgi:hypothetical protein
MKKEYLENYEAREEEEFGRYERKLLSQGHDPDEKYPPLDRFRLHHDPLVLYESNSFLFDKEKIWPQIPFAGTLIVTLHAYDKDHMLNGCGFEANDIPNLVRLAKETGRVQFALEDPPTLFEGMDHFDPIFQELNPPELFFLPLKLFVDDKTHTQWIEEFNALAEIKFNSSWIEFLKQQGMGGNSFASILQSRRDTFVNMKILNMREEVDTISNYLIDDPELADYLLVGYNYAMNLIFIQRELVETTL